MSGERVCIISTSHLSSNPRLVKEADALYDEGFAVKVIAGDTTAGVRVLDETIRARARWPVKSVYLGRCAHYFARRSRQVLARGIFAYYGGGDQVAEWALSPSTQRLAAAATAEPADLYIAHCLDALPAAAHAARRHGAKLGFDAEDDHIGELMDSPENQLEIAIRRRIEEELLPRCQHLTASSPGIARVYRERYGVTMTPILNVFSLSMAPSRPPDRRDGGALSVYWFSQTIGPGRGLEPLIEAMGTMRSAVSLSIRGSDFLGYSAKLKSIAADVGVVDAVHFLPSASPDEMVRLAASHDVGLSSELCMPPNRAICLTNKVFTYLLAGIPILMSNTPAQRELAAELGMAACVVDVDDCALVADRLDSWSMNMEALTAAKSAAWQLGQTRFNWDAEKKKLLQQVEQALT